MDISPFQISDFQIMQRIGQGNLGKIYLAQEKANGFPVVLKQLIKSKIIQRDFAKDQIQREIEI